MFSNNNTVPIDKDKINFILKSILCMIYSFKNHMSLWNMIKSRIVYALQQEKTIEDICIFYIKGQFESMCQDEIDFYDNNKIYIKHAAFIEDDIDKILKSIAISNKQFDDLKQMFYKWCVTDDNVLHSCNAPTVFNTNMYAYIKKHIDIMLENVEYF